MVHKKSTYRLMFRNYGAEVRKTVWEENNSLRLRRREEEMSHHSIEEEEESECDCDYSEDEVPERRKTLMKNVSCQSRPEVFVQEVPAAKPEVKKVHPNVPRLHFSPEESPRHEKVTQLENGETQNTKEPLDPQYLMPESDRVDDSRPRDISVEGRPLGVMRSRSQDREYDLIPVMAEEPVIRPNSASSSKVKLVRSHRYPYTSQLSRTTRKNYHDGDKKIVYLPVGSGEVVRTIGDQTSFNIHLNKDQVRSSALQASAKRSKEIESLIRRQRKINLEDWREKGNIERVNNSSIFLDGEKNIFSKSKPKESLVNDVHRIRVFSNYCKHCGGRK